MKIETKYDLKETVYFMYENKINKGYVQKIIYETDISVFNNQVTKILTYLVAVEQTVLNFRFSEYQLFKSKEELINSL